MGKRRCVGLIAICNSYLVRSKTGGSIALRNVTAQIYKKNNTFVIYGMGDGSLLSGSVFKEVEDFILNVKSVTHVFSPCSMNRLTFLSSKIIYEANA